MTADAHLSVLNTTTKHAPNLLCHMDFAVGFLHVLDHLVEPLAVVLPATNLAPHSSLIVGVTLRRLPDNGGFGGG